MRLKKLTAAAAAGVIAATVLAPAVSAGQLLGQTDFENGIGLPWHTCVTAPGECSFEIANGVYKLTVVNPGGLSRGGEDRWDVQFRHRGLHLTSTHNYTIKFEMTPSNSGKFHTKISEYSGEPELWHNGNTGQGDFGNTWNLINVTANQKYTMNCTFTPTSDATTDNTVEWAFHLGGDGQYTPSDCFPAGTVITFDNMSLIDNTSNEYDYEASIDFLYWLQPEDYRNHIVVNQVGYYANAEKKATLILDAASSTAKSFSVCDSSGTAVYTGQSTVFPGTSYSGSQIAAGGSSCYDSDSETYVHVLDFSSFDTEGSGYYISCDGYESYDFNIGAWIYDGLLDDSLNYFYQNRSAIAIESKYITSGDATSLARAAGHTSDVATIQTQWSNTPVLSGTTQDVTGGWYDAGDHGKYVVNGGISLWTLQNEYEMALKNGYEGETFGDGTLSIPENSNGYPDLLDEAAWEMDWFMTMEVKSGTNAGLVYHKAHDESWTALALAPADDEKDRIIKPASLCATYNAAACAAQAARLWNGIDSTRSATYLAFAKRTYAAAESKYVAYTKPSGTSFASLYAPLDQNIGGGPYGDTDATDEAYWAAAELYITTGDESYYSDMTTGHGKDHHLQAYTALYSGEDAGTIGFVNWGNCSGLGVMSLALNEDAIPAADYATLCDNIQAAADEFLEIQDVQGYGIPLMQSTSNAETGYVSITGYPWGSNSFVVTNGMLFAYAFEVSGYDAKYFNAATETMDYLFGRNPLDFSYISGYGDFKLTYPHHRWWSYQTDTTFPMAPSGVLSGGPNSTLQDPWVAGSGWGAGKRPPMLSYMDNIEAWSVNECTVNWNAPLAWMAGYLQENNDKSQATGLLGDINDDGVVNATDATMALRYSVGTLTLNDAALARGDVNGDGVVNATDATIILRYSVGSLTKFPAEK